MEVQSADTTVYSLSDEAPCAGEDRRDGERITTLYRVGSLLIDERRELCLIKNISAGGMMVRAYCPIPEGTRLSVELKCGQRIHGTVNWERDLHVGIAFDEPIDVIDILSTVHDSRPRMPRIEVASYVMLREGASTYRLQLCDVSQGGFKVRCDTLLPIGSDVVVTLAGIEPQPGVVRWARDDQMGITLNRMLALPVLVEWLRGERDAQRDAQRDAD